MAQGMNLGGIQVLLTYVTERLSTNGLALVLSRVGYPHRRVWRHPQQVHAILHMEVFKQHGGGLGIQLITHDLVSFAKESEGHLSLFFTASDFDIFPTETNQLASPAARCQCDCQNSIVSHACPGASINA